MRLTSDLAVGLRGRLPVDDDGARFVLLAHHCNVFRGGAGNCGGEWILAEDIVLVTSVKTCYKKEALSGVFYRAE